MKYEARMFNIDGIGKPSVIPIEANERGAAIEKFHRLTMAHGDQSVLKLKLIQIDKSNTEVEIA